MTSPHYISRGLFLVAFLICSSISVLFPYSSNASGSWETLPTFTQRKNHKTLLIENGKILSAGGETTVPINWVTQLTIQSGIPSWSNKKDMSMGRRSHTMTKLQNGTVLITGGSGSTATSSGIQNTTEIYNPDTNNWQRVGIMNVPRSSHTATLLKNGKVIVIGGLYRSPNLATNSAELLNPSNPLNAWERKSPMPVILGGHTATPVTIDGKEHIFVTGGSNSTTLSNKTYLYDVENDSWSTGPTMNFTRYSHTATLLNDGRVLIAGGSNNAAEIWSPITNTFTLTPPMTYNRQRHTAELLNDGRIILIGGSGSHALLPGTGTAANTTEIYDPATNTWALDASMNTPRTDHASTKLDDGRIVVSGGTSTNGNTGSTEIYTPEEIAPPPPPTPTGPEPFLDLPWNYSLNNMSFTEAALTMNTMFDHEYPLLRIGSSHEPLEAKTKITGYDGRQYKFYSTHDGYDWGSNAKTKSGVSVLAAADGTATYIPKSLSDGCGNEIRIDHANNYQTRYCHLQDIGLITNNATEEVDVIKGQQIGLVGFTGHVDPPGVNGSHIHFALVEDKNKDGNFNDNIPDGVTDPFGWHGATPDPWENYNFTYLNKELTGNKSYYLWNQKLDTLKETLSINGGTLSSGKTQITYPPELTNNNTTIEIKYHPAIKISKTTESLGSTAEITAKDSNGNPVTTFNKPFDLTIDFSSTDMQFYKTASIAIHSSIDGENWTKEPTNLDLINKKASVTIDHLTHFAVLAELTDTTPPVTSPIFIGDKGIENNFKSDVELSLIGNDGDGLGINKTFYQYSSTDEWKEYTEPFTYTNEGTYQIQYYSIDEMENSEDAKSTSFTIDKAPPEIEAKFDIEKLTTLFSGIDGSNSAELQQSNGLNGLKEVKSTDHASNTAKLIFDKKIVGNIHYLNPKSLQYNSSPSITLPQSMLVIIYSQNKNKSLKTLVQTYLVKNETVLVLTYNPKKYTTTATKYEGKKKKNTTLPGLKILKLYTDKGQVKYIY